MNQLTLTYDPCANRHGGNPQSIAAHERASVGKSESHRAILALLRVGPLTAKEVAARLYKPLHALSGRLTELSGAGLIERTGEVRDGAAEWRVR